MTRGAFIVIEGGEGSGKTSHLKKLKEEYPEVVTSREPGGSPYAEEIRNIILHSDYAADADAKTHFALFWAARADHLRYTIIPALESGQHVITDRFDASTYAYQVFGQQARELEEMFFEMRDFYLGNWKPDLYIYLDVSSEKGLRRRSNDKGTNTHFDERDVQFHQDMRRGFETFFERVPHQTIDADADADTVYEGLRDEVLKYVT